MRHVETLSTLAMIHRLLEPRLAASHCLTGALEVFIVIYLTKLIIDDVLRVIALSLWEAKQAEVLLLAKLRYILCDHGTFRTYQPGVCDEFWWGVGR